MTGKWLAVRGWGGLHSHFCTHFGTINSPRGNACTIVLNRTFFMSRHSLEARWRALHRDFFYIEIHRVVFAGDVFFWGRKIFSETENSGNFYKGKSMEIENFKKIPNIFSLISICKSFPKFLISKNIFGLRKIYLMAKLLDEFQYTKNLDVVCISALLTNVST